MGNCAIARHRDKPVEPARPCRRHRVYCGLGAGCDLVPHAHRSPPVRSNGSGRFTGHQDDRLRRADRPPVVKKLCAATRPQHPWTVCMIDNMHHRERQMLTESRAFVDLLHYWNIQGLYVLGRMAAIEPAHAATQALPSIGSGSNSLPQRRPQLQGEKLIPPWTHRPLAESDNAPPPLSNPCGCARIRLTHLDAG